MKKFLAFLFIFAFIFALVGCKKKNETKNPTDEPKTQETEQTQGKQTEPVVTPTPDPTITPAPTPVVTPTPTPTIIVPTILPTEPTVDELIAQMLESMSLEDKIAQMIMLSCRTRDGSNFTSMTPEVAALLESFPFAGMILFGQNIVTNEQTYDLISAIQEASKKDGRPGLLISVDQEGGRVVRLEEGTTTPGNMALGAINDTEITTSIASIIGSELNCLGFNTTFAPVVDVNNNPNNPVIGVRSFSDDPLIVSQQAKAFLEGLTKNNVIGCLKHFPGHGDTATDSHTGLPLIDKTLDELVSNELFPYITNMNSIEMIMTAHIVYPQIEKETYVSKYNSQTINLPATLSKTFLTDVLRGRLGYEGVVITDAMEMDAISKHFDVYDAARLAINGGVDILLMPVDITYSNGIANLEEYIAKLADEVRNEKISLDRINESVTRILKLKYNHNLFKGYQMGSKDALPEVGSEINHALELIATTQAITLVKNDNVLPLQSEDKVLIIGTSNSDYNSVQYGLNLASKEATFMAMNAVDTSSFADTLKDYDKVIILSSMNNKSYLTSETASKIDSLIDIIKNNNKKSIILSINLPYDAARFTKADAFVICYSNKGMTEIPKGDGSQIKQYGPNIPAAIYMILNGNDFNGKLPVVIYSLDNNYNFTNEVLYARGYSYTKPE